MKLKPLLDFTLDADSRIPLSEQIVTHFEQMVLSGKLPQNLRLPNGMKLAKEWGCSYVTVQKAMRQLAAKGLAHRKPQKGTFVNVPETTRIVAVLVGPNLATPSAGYFRGLASGVAARIDNSALWPPTADGVPRKEGTTTLWAARVYDNIQSVDGENHPGIHNLLEDLKRHDFAGRIYIGMDTRRFEFLEKLLPAAHSNHSFVGASSVTYDTHDFTTASVRHLAGQGMEQMVYFRTSAERPDTYRDCTGMFEACAACSLPVPEIRQIRFDESVPGYQLEALAHDETLRFFRDFEGGPKTGVIVSDDIAARGIALALIRLGLDRPDRVRLLTGANEGIEYFYGMPVARYERSLSTIVEHLTANLWRQIIGKPAAEPVTLKGKIRPAVFEASEIAVG